MQKGILHIISLFRLNTCHLLFTILVLLAFAGQTPADSNATDADITTNTTPSPDFDGDGVVGIPDFLLFVDQFGLSRGDERYEARFDLDGDGTIGIGDFLIFVDAFGKIVFTDPQIYNDNVFVLPVTENLAALWTSSSGPPLRDYTARFYEHFNDEFDFLIFYPNVDLADLEHEAIEGAYYARVRNDVQGIGLDTFSDNSSWSSAGKLQGVVFHNYDDPSIFRGLLLHELMHRWGNFVVPITSFPYGAHWGLSTSGGYLDCYDISNWIDHGDGRYSAPDPFYEHSSEQYSPIELYLAGYIPPEEVPDFQTAEDADWLRDEGDLVTDDNGYRMFTASGFKTHTIEDIIAEHGPRVPDHLQAQKDFRAAVILLVSERYPATRERLERLSGDVTWFSQVGKDESGPPVTNFYEATGGRGTITMDGLSQFQSRAATKRLVPSSYGTPPPPIVDHWE